MNRIAQIDFVAYDGAIYISGAQSIITDGF